MERQSETLCNILEKLGVTEEVRTWFKEAADSLDELEFLQLEVHCKLPSSLHTAKTVGSFSEGTFRTSYNSDRDVLNIHPDIEVFEDVDTVSCKSYCVIESLPLKPGYVHIRVPPDSTVLHDNSVSVKCSKSGDSYLQHKTPKAGLFNIESNGPAHRNRCAFCEIDNVHCFKCPWPSIVKEWKQRRRHNGWPSEETIILLQTIPCVVVQSGHPDSSETEKELEWRLSFTLQENHLMCRLNDIQFKCYVLLKMIKEDLITERFGKTLTSYHCKTVLFYTIEQNPESIWRSDNLINCLVMCLTKLKHFIETGLCPNFFIPSVDLFHGKIEKNILPDIGRVLDSITKDPVAMLSSRSISSSNFGKMYGIAISLDVSELDPSNKLTSESELRDLENEAMEEIIQTVHGIFIMLNFIVDGIVDYCLYEMEKALSMDGMSIPLAFWFVISKQSAFYNRLQTTMGKCGLRFHVLPVLYASLASHLYDMAKETQDRTLRDWLICASALNFIYAMEGDEKVVANLKLANVLFISGHVQSAKSVLNFVKFDIDSRKIPLMTKDEAEDMPLHLRLMNALRRMAKSGLNEIFTFPMYMLFTRFSFRPIVFLRSELGVTQKGLVFEAFRSMGTRPGSRFDANFFYDRTSLDAVSFYTFLNFLVEGEESSFHSLFGQMDKIKFGNGVTYLNLLGWVSIEEEDFEMAAYLFLESWKQNAKEIKMIQKQNIYVPPTIFQHNAAKLHMLLLIYENWKVNHS